MTYLDDLCREHTALHKKAVHYCEEHPIWGIQESVDFIVNKIYIEPEGFQGFLRHLGAYDVEAEGVYYDYRSFETTILLKITINLDSLYNKSIATSGGSKAFSQEDDSIITFIKESS